VLVHKKEQHREKSKFNGLFTSCFAGHSDTGTFLRSLEIKRPHLLRIFGEEYLLGIVKTVG
jgi:hypothetical protein